MRRPSRQMPPRQLAQSASEWWFLSAVLVLLVLVFWLHPVAGVALFLLCAIVALMAWSDRRREDRLAAARAGETICSFVRALDIRSHDTWVVRAVYDELQASVTFPIRPTDSLWDDLRLDIGDFELDIVPDIAQRCGRSLDDASISPFTARMETVQDLISFFDAQTRLD